MRTEPLLLLITLVSFLTACGGGGGGASTPAPVNNAPTITAQTFSTQDDQTLASVIVAADADGDELSFALAADQTLPDTVNFDLNEDGSFSYRNTTSTNASVNIQVQVSDGRQTATTTMTFSTTTDRLFSHQWH